MVPAGKSWVVVVPIDWVRGNQLEDHRDVVLTYSSETLVIRPRKDEEITVRPGKKGRRAR